MKMNKLNLKRKFSLKKFNKPHANPQTAHTRSVVEHTLKEDIQKSLKVYKISLSRALNNLKNSFFYKVCARICEKTSRHIVRALTASAVFINRRITGIRQFDYRNLLPNKNFFYENRNFFFEAGIFIIIGLAVFAAAKIINDYSLSINFIPKHREPVTAFDRSQAKNKQAPLANVPIKDTKPHAPAQPQKKDRPPSKNIATPKTGFSTQPSKKTEPAQPAKNKTEDKGIVFIEPPAQNRFYQTWFIPRAISGLPKEPATEKPANLPNINGKTGKTVLQEQQKTKLENEKKELENQKKKDRAFELFAEGKAKADSGNIGEAIKLLRQAESYYPQIPQLQYYMGIALCTEGKYKDGIKYLEQAYKLSLEPGILEPIKNAYFMYGIQQAVARRFKSAEKLFSRVLEIDPKDGRCYFNRGVCRTTLNDFSGALSDFNSALSNNYKTLELLFNKAVALEKSGKPENAILQYKAILKEEPLFAPAHFNLAKLMETKIDESLINDPASNSAIYHYKRALEIDSDFYQAAYNIGQIFYRAKKYQACINWAKKCIEMKENFPEAHLFLAESYLKNKSYYNALAQIEYMEKKGYNFDQTDQMKEEIYKIIGKKNAGQ